MRSPSVSASSRFFLLAADTKKGGHFHARPFEVIILSLLRYRTIGAEGQGVVGQGFAVAVGHGVETQGFGAHGAEAQGFIAVCVGTGPMTVD